MMGEDTDSAYTDLACGVSSDSDVSEEECKPHTHKRKKSQRSKSWGSRGKQKKDKDDKPKKNTCPHCKKFHCKKPHRVEPDKCTWNKKYKGNCFKSICKELEVAFKPRHKFLTELGGYASKGNKSGDNWRCAGTPENGEKDNDKWITVTGNGKTKTLLTPKPNPKVHNAFAILSQPDALTHYNVLRPTQQIKDDKTIIPPGPREHCRQQKIARRRHIKQTLWRLCKSDDLFLDNSITQDKDEHTAIAKNDINNVKHVAIDSTHAQCNQPTIGLAQCRQIQPTTWVQHSIEPSKS
jgi:hypothetical protein